MCHCVPCLHCLNRMPVYFELHNCIVQAFRSKMYVEWAWAHGVPRSSTTGVRLCVRGLGWVGMGGGGAL